MIRVFAVVCLPSSTINPRISTPFWVSSLSDSLSHLIIARSLRKAIRDPRGNGYYSPHWKLRPEEMFPFQPEPQERAPPAKCGITFPQMNRSIMISPTTRILASRNRWLISSQPDEAYSVSSSSLAYPFSLHKIGNRLLQPVPDLHFRCVVEQLFSLL